MFLSTITSDITYFKMNFMWILIYFILAVLVQLVSLHGPVLALSINRVIVNSDSCVGVLFKPTLCPSSLDNGWINNPGLETIHTMIQYSRDKVLNLKEKSVHCKLPSTVHSVLKQNGLLRGRGRRAGKCTRRKKLDNPPSTNTSSPENRLHVCVWNAQSIRNKTVLFADFALEHDVDIFFLTETWLRDDDTVIIGELTLPGYSFISIPRANGRQGGGLGVLFKSHLKLRRIPEHTIDIQSFEYAIVSDVSRTVNYCFLDWILEIPKYGHVRCGFNEGDAIIHEGNEPNPGDLDEGNAILHTRGPTADAIQPTVDSGGPYSNQEGTATNAAQLLDATQIPDEPIAKSTRSGRQVKKPRKYNDFVV